MRITIFDVEDWEREGFKVLSDRHELKLVAEPLSVENVAEHRGAEVVS